MMKRNLTFYAAIVLTAMSVFFPFAAEAQERVVSVGGDVTEIVYALGKGDALVATDSTSVYPKEANDTPKVGYVRQLAAEGVLSLEPDLIIISGAAGPPPALEQLRASGVQMLEMPASYTIEAILEKVDKIALTLGAVDKGALLRARIEAERRGMKDRVAKLGLSPKVLFFVTLQNGVPQAAGIETAAHGVIELLGGENVFASHSGYKSLSLEAAVAADPDIILVMSHHADRLGGMEAVKSHPAISLTRAVQENRVILVDPVTVMQFGPRLPSAVADLAEQIASEQAAGL
ncbi:MAG: ABC transporter substrate-binding protein [Pseudomonadota bacterium]